MPRQSTLRSVPQHHLFDPHFEGNKTRTRVRLNTGGPAPHCSAEFRASTALPPPLLRRVLRAPPHRAARCGARRAPISDREGVKRTPNHPRPVRGPRATPSPPTQPMPAPSPCVGHQMAEKHAPPLRRRPPLRLRTRKLSTYPVDVGTRSFFTSPAPHFKCSRQIRPEKNPICVASTVVDAALASPTHPHIGDHFLAPETEVNTNNLEDWIGDNVFAGDLPRWLPARSHSEPATSNFSKVPTVGGPICRRDHLLRARR